MWGAFDSDGKLRAIFDSESEAYFYLRNRGHVNGGTYRKVTLSEVMVWVSHG